MIIISGVECRQKAGLYKAENSCMYMKEQEETVPKEFMRTGSI